MMFWKSSHVEAKYNLFEYSQKGLALEAEFLDETKNFVLSCLLITP